MFPVRMHKNASVCSPLFVTIILLLHHWTSYPRHGCLACVGAVEEYQQIVFNIAYTNNLFN